MRCCFCWKKAAKASSIVFKGLRFTICLLRKAKSELEEMCLPEKICHTWTGGVRHARWENPFSLLSDSICAYLPSPQVASGWIQPWRCLWILRPGNIAFWSQLCGSMLSKGWPLQRHETACTGKGTRRVSTFSPKLIFAFFATPAKKAWHVN